MLCFFIRFFIHFDNPFSGQYIIYNCINGRTRITKQVQLALFTKRITGLKLLVGVLNKLGHSLLYPELNAVETDVANKQLKNQNIHSDVPTSLILQTITTYVSNNCDHNPESQFGAIPCTAQMALQSKNEYVLNSQPPWKHQRKQKDVSRLTQSLWRLNHTYKEKPLILHALLNSRIMNSTKHLPFQRWKTHYGVLRDTW